MINYQWKFYYISLIINNQISINILFTNNVGYKDENIFCFRHFSRLFDSLLLYNWHFDGETIYYLFFEFLFHGFVCLEREREREIFFFTTLLSSDTVHVISAVNYYLRLMLTNKWKSERNNNWNIQCCTHARNAENNIIQNVNDSRILEEEFRVRYLVFDIILKKWREKNVSFYYYFYFA